MTEPAALPRTEPVLDSVTRADQSDELATTTLLRAAIGPVNTNYYLGIFTRFDAQDKTKASWNTAAALSTLNWMLYRRMWNTALAYVGIALTVALLVFGIGKLALHYSSEVQWALVGLYTLLLVVLPGLFGNTLLFKQYRRDMARALSAHQTLPDAATMLAVRAPNRQRLAVLAGLNLAVAAAVLAVVQWAANFNGLPSSLEALPAGTPVASPAPSGNVAVGRAMEVSALEPTATQAAVTVAVAASAMPTTASPLPVGTPAAPAKATASAPTATVSDTTTKDASIPNAGRGRVQPALSAPVRTTQASTPPGSPAVPTAASAASAPRTVPALTTPPPPQTTLGASATPGHFVINVGLFADDNNVRNALVKLKDAGLVAYTQEIRGKNGKRTWVRVGPFNAISQAENAVESIRALGLDAQVVKQSP